MSTDTEWSDERIAELRRVAEATSAITGHRGDDAAFGDAVNERVVLSLLSELERVREERDGLKDAFEDVMGALAKALDGDDGYAERPAELVWRLRDDRDGWKEEAGR